MEDAYKYVYVFILMQGTDVILEKEIIRNKRYKNLTRMLHHFAKKYHAENYSPWRTALDYQGRTER